MSTKQVHSEKELLQKIAQGDQKAFETLIHHHSSKLYTYIYRITGNTNESEELVQDIFIQLWQTREGLASIDNLGAFLYILSRNRAANALKRLIRSRVERDKWVHQAWLQADEEEDPQQRWQLLDRAVEALPPQQQKIWKMSRGQRMKYAEIAAELGISTDAVKKSLQAAAKNITTFIQQHPQAILSFLAFIVSKK